MIHLRRGYFGLVGSVVAKRTNLGEGRRREERNFRCVSIGNVNFKILHLLLSGLQADARVPTKPSQANRDVHSHPNSLVQFNYQSLAKLPLRAIVLFLTLFENLFLLNQRGGLQCSKHLERSDSGRPSAMSPLSAASPWRFSPFRQP